MLSLSERRTVRRRRTDPSRSTAASTRNRAGEVASGAERRARVALALSRSTERERLVLALILLERMSPVEAADTLGISLRALRRTYRDSLASLRGALYGFGPDGFESSRMRGARVDRMRRVS